MKLKHSALSGTLALVLAGVALAAQAPQIDSGRIDSMVNQVLKQVKNNPQAAQQQDGKLIRENVIKQLQSFEILKNEAIKIGLDKDSDIQNQLKNLEAEFYANQYIAHLERSTEVSEADIYRAYQEQTRMVQIQQVHFDSEAQAREAQALLLKGLSFEQLMQRYPNPEQDFKDFVSPQQLAPEIGQTVAQMTRGEVSRDPLMFNGKYYLLKVSADERNPNAPPYAEAKQQIEQQVKRQRVQEKITSILNANGLK